jgi:hypothetical protein
MTFGEISHLIKTDIVSISFLKTAVHRITLEYAKLMYSSNTVKEIYATKRHGLVILLESNLKESKDNE